VTRNEFESIEKHMLSCMTDSAHDKHHVCRVLYAAVDIASHEAEQINEDVLLAACLLHDIGRERQAADPSLCHAAVGGEMACDFLLARGWDEAMAGHVKACISTHRYRSGNSPQSVEAKILFDADKLDVSGAMGIARTLIYEGQVTEPLYILDEKNGILTDAGGGEEPTSFFQEYNYKLCKVYDAFYTARARDIALSRRKTAVDFYKGLYDEITGLYQTGSSNLAGMLSK